MVHLEESPLTVKAVTQTGCPGCRGRGYLPPRSHGPWTAHLLLLVHFPSGETPGLPGGRMTHPTPVQVNFMCQLEWASGCPKASHT